jgi:hypothetical protein
MATGDDVGIAKTAARFQIVGVGNVRGVLERLV